MYKPDKTTTERNAKVLRELVKQPDNKLCADCKRNDPRWASWNLGVYLCIRCSGIHRGMGTHISRVKSIDLDMWTPEQMESIQKWGNRRANLYWEAHLKSGHIPPDHKMESYIRSKYESRRWALDGPAPADPSILEGPAPSGTNEDTIPAPLLDTPASASPSSPVRSMHAPSASLSTPRPASPALHSPATFRQNTAYSYSQSRQLLSAAVAGRVQVASSLQSPQSQPKAQPQPQQSQQQQQQKPEDDLFSLDFHATPATKSTTPPQPPAKDVKQDILSLFSTPSQSVQPSNAFGQFASTQSPWDAAGTMSLAQTTPTQSQSQPPQQPVSIMNTASNGLWGGTSAWTGAPNASMPSANIWGATSTTMNANTSTNTFGMLNTMDVWGGSSTAHTSNGSVTVQSTAGKKDDAFGDLWGDFK